MKNISDLPNIGEGAVVLQAQSSELSSQVGFAPRRPGCNALSPEALERAAADSDNPMLAVELMAAAKAMQGRVL